jgi:imidazolonepropionase-like amidohydrolase
MAEGVLFRGMRLLDPRWDEARDGYEVLVEGGTIKEVSDRPIRTTSARVMDGAKRTLMPGLIDCHAHIFLSEVSLRALEAVPLTLLGARALVLARAMLDRGFTTVRDTGGADWGIKQAINDGLQPGPRLFISGATLSPTGGHGDFRRRTDTESMPAPTNAMRYVSCVADGPDAVRAAAREQMRQGADQVKIMCSGGVASPYDPLDSLQYTADEIRAATDEAQNFGRYVAAHAYTPEAIRRAVENGVRTIEHGNLIDEPTAKLLAERKRYLVANLVTYVAMRERGAALGLTSEMLAKNERVLEAGLRSLEICKRAGVPVAYGSDLLGALQEEQSREFVIRAEVLRPIEIIRQATLVGAQILREERTLGIIEPGARADLLMVDGDPLRDLGVLLDQGAHLTVIMQSGRFHKNELH